MDSYEFSLKLRPVLGTTSLREGFVLYHFHAAHLIFSGNPYH